MEKIGIYSNPLKIACNYLDISLQEALKIAVYGKEDFKELWFKKERKSEEEYRNFYSESNFYICRLLWAHRRHSWYEVLLFQNEGDKILKYGAGVRPVAKWLLEKRKNVDITLADIPSSTWKFVKWYFKDKVKYIEIGLGKDGLPLKEKYNIIICYDVLEHTINPLEIVQHLYEHLADQGKLFINFINACGGYNLEEASKQRNEVISFLNNKLCGIKKLEINKNIGRGLYIKK